MLFSKMPRPDAGFYELVEELLRGGSKAHVDQDHFIKTAKCSIDLGGGYAL